MSTVVAAPAAVSAVCDVRFRSTALDVVQPNRSTSGTVAVTNSVSVVSVSKHVANDSCCCVIETVATHGSPGAVMIYRS